MDRCPTCRARVCETTACSRCGTDLSGLLAIEAEAAAALKQAVAHLAEGHLEAAGVAVEASLRLKRQPLALALRDFLASRSQPEGIPSADWFWPTEGRSSA